MKEYEDDYIPAETSSFEKINEKSLLFLTLNYLKKIKNKR